MTTTALSCGNLDSATQSDSDALHWHELSETPDRTEVDPLLAETSGRLVVHGSDAALAAVVLRLLRKGRLSDITLGYVPVAESPVSRMWDIPMGDFERALHAPGAPTPLPKDDTGGVLLGKSTIAPITGQVYCDDTRVLHGRALRLTVTPDPMAAALPEPTDDPIGDAIQPIMDGLRATVTRRGAVGVGKRTEVTRGRAVQAAFQEATVWRDGVAHPRPINKWVWHRHTRDVLLAR